MGKLKKQETEPHRYGVRKSSVNILFMIRFLKNAALNANLILICL